MRSIDIGTQLEINQLFAHYAWAFDSGDVESYASTFVEDGILLEGSRPLARGRENIALVASQFVAARQKSTIQHINSNLVHVPGEPALTLHSDYAVLSKLQDGESPIIVDVGRYISRCVRTGSGWLFASRSYSSGMRR